MLDMIDAFPGEMTPEGDGPVIELSAGQRLLALGNTSGDFSAAIDLEDLRLLGMQVCEDYERDKADRKDWAETAEEALTLASQEQNGEASNYPWKGCANVRFPLLTTAALQFNARAYPAIVKGDEAVSVKVVGRDQGIPNPEFLQLMAQMEAMQGQVPPIDPAQLPPQWIKEPGTKTARAQRVAEYLNTVLFYRMEDWEADTDTLLIQLPVVGCVFRKVWYCSQSRQQRAAMVSALRIFVPQGARSCDTTPRLTEEIPDVYPYQIQEKMRSGYYREVLLDDQDDETDAGARTLLEQHRMIDVDGDGLEEPYIVTVDYKTQRVLRLEPNFGPEDVRTDEQGQALSIKRGKFFIKYDFFPHPKGQFYGIGLGHLLAQLGDVVDTAINQLIDAGTAQTAGGGFIASGVRLQGRGSVVKFQPGEYKTVDVTGGTLRDAMVERTMPNVSPVTFQVLDLILGAARDISGVKDVITGEASNNGQVGTTLALIEQGLQVFNAVYKRVYRALKEEFSLIYRNLSRFGGEEARIDYAEVMDDPAANFEADFNARDMDIRPVSDPTSVTRMQKMARAQFLMSTIGTPGANPVAILKRVYEAADTENPDELIMQPPEGPSPDMVAKVEKDKSSAALNMAKAQQVAAQTPLDQEKLQLEALKAGMQAGAQAV